MLNPIKCDYSGPPLLAHPLYADYADLKEYTDKPF
jgi:hypothetical protein